MEKIENERKDVKKKTKQRKQILSLAGRKHILKIKRKKSSRATGRPKFCV